MVAKRDYDQYKAIPKHKRTVSQQWHIDHWEAEEKNRQDFRKIFGLEVDG